MNLCLRTNGRKKCAEIAEQAITVLSSLLTHPNQEVHYLEYRKGYSSSEMNFYFLENKLLIFKFQFSAGNQIEFLLYRKSSLKFDE